MAPQTAWLLAYLVGSHAALATDSLRCPDGTSASEVTNADGTEAWCARPNGTRHGPSQKTSPEGRILGRGDWVNGERQGTWRYYNSEGRIIRTGQMSAGQQTGSWTHFDSDSTPSAFQQSGLVAKERSYAFCQWLSTTASPAASCLNVTSKGRTKLAQSTPSSPASGTSPSWSVTTTTRSQERRSARR